MIEERYKEEYEEGSDLLWPSNKEDKITRQFYEDLSILSKNQNSNNKKRKSFFDHILQLIIMKRYLKFSFQ